MPSDFHCWHCGKSLLGMDKKIEDELWENEIFFHCNKECQDKCKIHNYTPPGIPWVYEEGVDSIIEREKREKEIMKKNEPKKVGRKCSRCDESGHNVRTCKNEKKDKENGTKESKPSPVVSSKSRPQQSGNKSARRVTGNKRIRKSKNASRTK